MMCIHVHTYAHMRSCTHTHTHTSSSRLYTYVSYSLKFSRVKYFMVLPISAQKTSSNFSWSSFQPCLASVMNLKFCGRKFCGCSLTCEIHKNFRLYCSTCTHTARIQGCTHSTCTHTHMQETTIINILRPS